MAVLIDLTGHHFDVTDEIRRYVERKLGRLDRFLPVLATLTVKLTHEPRVRESSRRFVAEATALVPGAILRAEEHGPSPQAAIDAVTDTLERQIERFKSRLYVNLGRYESRRAQLARAAAQAEAAPAPAGRAAGEEEQEPAELVRIKRFAVKPMLTEEAIEQMELLGHSFFVFLNARTQSLNVVYRRAEGGYGLLVPEVG